jgi:hypothetical protein
MFTVSDCPFGILYLRFAPVVLLFLQSYVMNEERAGLGLRQMEHIRGYL